MSLILDALRKLEREKSLSRGGEMKIATGILSPEPVRSRANPAVIALAAVLVSVCAAGTTWLVLAGTSQPGAAVHETKPPGQTPQSAPPHMQAPVTPTPPPAIPEPAVKAPAAAPAVHAKKLEPKNTVPAANSVNAETQRGKNPERLRAEPDGSEPALKVSGIVWFDEPTARRAFVNGVPVREGDLIEGSRVERIDPNLVRFTRNGKTVDVKIY